MSGAEQLHVCIFADFPFGSSNKKELDFSNEISVTNAIIESTHTVRKSPLVNFEPLKNNGVLNTTQWSMKLIVFVPVEKNLLIW